MLKGEAGLHAALLTAVSFNIIVQTYFIKIIITKLNLINFVALIGFLIRCNLVSHLPLRIWDHFGLIFGLGFRPEGRFGVSRCERLGSTGWQNMSFLGSKANLEGGNLPTVWFKRSATQIS